MKKNIALTGGYTGGHIFPLLAIYNYFKGDNKYNFIWVGEEGNKEDEIAEKNEIPFYDISAGKIRRYFDLRNLYEPLKNLTGLFEGLYYIKKHKIDIVFSKGGYVSLPLTIAAKIMGKDIYIHESDIIGGISNKVVSCLATKVFYTFPNEKIDNKKHILSGQILNTELTKDLDTINIRENKNLNLLVTGGSQGSTIIFDSILKVIDKLDDIDFHIILGEKNEHFKEKFEKFEKYKNIKIYKYISQKKLGKLLKNIDIAITRGGATTLWELYNFGIHSIIVPLKGSAGNHQENNAQYFNKKYGSNILKQDKDLSKNLEKLIIKYKAMRKNGLNLKDIFKPLEIIKKEIKK